jgi:hypothetical protein
MEGQSPKVCFWMRPAEYRGTDLVDLTVGPLGRLKPTFEELVYGGFRFSTGLNGLDESVTSRIKTDIERENTQCFDLEHPDAFKNNGKFRVEDLNKEDFALNAAAFSDAGSSGGLNYNIFCSGNVTLTDGRLLIAGGHDKTGNSGVRKINIFDPATQSWLPRPVPPVKADFLADPTGLLFRHANPLNELNTDPPDRSDMRYQRWYPTAVTLPDGRVLILSGTDQDTSVGPAGVAATKVRQAVPEVYDPKTDRTIALESARKLFMMYPHAYVVQTGPGKDDWKVAVTGEVQPPLPQGDALRAYDPFTYNGNTYLLDVLGALADPDIDVPAENHWELVSTAKDAHNTGAGAALWTLGADGKALSQKVVAFGGNSGAGSQAVATVEMIDFQGNNPQWERQEDLVQAATQNNAVVLPDGQVLIIGGASGRGASFVNSFRLQMFDPDSGKIRTLVSTNVPRHDHSTALLSPDATVYIMGGNRTDLVPGSRDAGVPVLQIYYPAYLFQGPRPLMEQAPAQIFYGTGFELQSSDKIKSVVLIRMGPVTHNWDWGNRYVRLAFDESEAEDEEGGKLRELHVQSPALPALAIPGYYMLFVVNEEGVPSVAKLVHLEFPDESRKKMGPRDCRPAVAPACDPDRKGQPRHSPALDHRRPVPSAGERWLDHQDRGYRHLYGK